MRAASVLLAAFVALALSQRAAAAVCPDEPFAVQGTCYSGYKVTTQPTTAVVGVCSCTCGVARAPFAVANSAGCTLAVCQSTYTCGSILSPSFTYANFTAFTAIAPVPAPIASVCETITMTCTAAAVTAGKCPGFMLGAAYTQYTTDTGIGCGLMEDNIATMPYITAASACATNNCNVQASPSASGAVSSCAAASVAALIAVAVAVAL
jgi:hypothetical protein